MSDLVISNTEAFEASLKAINTRLEELQSAHTKASIQTMASYRNFIKSHVEGYFKEAEETLTNLKKNHPVEDIKYLLTLLNSAMRSPIRAITSTDPKASDVNFLYAGKEFTDTFKELTIDFIVNDTVRGIGYFNSLNNQIHSGLKSAESLLKDLNTFYMTERGKYELMNGIGITLKNKAFVASDLSTRTRETERKLDVLVKYLEENSMTSTIASADKGE